MQSAEWTLHSWAQVRPWFARHYRASELDEECLTTEHDRLIAAADHPVRARALMRGDDLTLGLGAHCCLSSVAPRSRPPVALGQFLEAHPNRLVIFDNLPRECGALKIELASSPNNGAA